MLMVPNLRVIEPNNIYRKVPTRRPNGAMRTREYLTPAEVEKLIAAAKLGRHGHARPKGEERQARCPPYPRR